MDPNSSPWAYAYNRIVPSTSGSNDDYQHTHLASISAAAGSSAQSLLLQAAHSSIAGFNATSGNFVPPSPIGGYNPVFQQIYHHAAQAAVQPKPAHYASSPVSTSHRHLGVTGLPAKQESCRLGYTTNQTINVPTSSYYGENSSSSGASPSPTTNVTSSTTLSWNSPMDGTPQQMSTNIFVPMHHQQQQPTITQLEKVNNPKQAGINAKSQPKTYNDVIYVGNHQHQIEQTMFPLDNQNIQAVSDEDARSEEGFYTIVDGKLSYSIPAAAISSLTNKLPVASIKVVSPRKQSSNESHQPILQQGLRQIPSPAYPLYERPSLCSSVGSSPPTVDMQTNEAINNSEHINVYKVNTPIEQSQTSHDDSNIGNGVNNNCANNFTRSNLSSNSLPPTTNVGYSSVITSAFHIHQQQHLHPEHHGLEQPVCWLGGSSKRSSDTSMHDQKRQSLVTSNMQENSFYILPPSLKIKRTIIEPCHQNVQSPPNSAQLQHETVNNTMSSRRNLVKCQPNDMQILQPQKSVQSKHQQFVENGVSSNNSQVSQIQNTTKAVEDHKPVPTKKAPRKRQPKKTLLANNEYLQPPIQNNSLGSTQQQQQTIQLHPGQQHQQIEQQPQNGSFYDYNGRWAPQKIENNIHIPLSNHHQSQSSNQIPLPAHVQSSQTHQHAPQSSQYYPAFPQHVSTQYAACMSQNTNLYTLSTEISREQQIPENVSNSSLQQENISTQSEQLQEDTSIKVIVPNIEDELHFLSTAEPQKPIKTEKKQTAQKNISVINTNVYCPLKTNMAAGTKSAFMDSYLKFLQGERDESPPPLMKTGRKYNYQKQGMQPDYAGAAKRKSVDTNQKTITTSSDLQTTSSDDKNKLPETTNSNSIDTRGDDGHKIKIISQTQILPKKRPQAQNMAASVQQAETNVTEVPQPQQRIQNQPLPKQNQPSPKQTQQQHVHQDPLALPPRRQPSLRKAKCRPINDVLKSSAIGIDRDDPEEFTDSDTDPVWTPLEDDSDDIGTEKYGGKRKIRRNKASTADKKKEVRVSTESNPDAISENVNKISSISTSSTCITECPATSGNVSTADNLKTGDFIVLRSDLVNDWPTIWQVDSKCILQKYESFCQNGKIFYRNMSKYASWNLETKKLYLKAPVRIQVQSHTETIVEFMRSELLADDTEQFIEKVMEDYLTYRDHFEIYIQTMISQVLDPSFFSEINREKDEYFLSSIRTIDEIMENCKRKLLSITPWTRSVIVSIETWPQCHVFTEWGQNNLNQKNCGGCHQPGISVRFLLFGHPYNTSTMQTIPIDMRVAYEKDILLCRICAARADIFHKIAHEKYNLFAICTRRVEEHQKKYAGKCSTDILNDLLAENNWVDELFRNMRSSWAEVESLERQKRFHEGS